VEVRGLAIVRVEVRGLAIVRVEVLALVIVPAAEEEQLIARVVELETVRVAAPAKIKLVTALHRHGRVRVPKKVEDLAAVAAETTPGQAAIEVAKAWAVAE
jgi:hypothetical protein